MPPISIRYQKHALHLIISFYFLFPIICIRSFSTRNINANSRFHQELQNLPSKYQHACNSQILSPKRIDIVFPILKSYPHRLYAYKNDNYNQKTQRIEQEKQQIEADFMQILKKAESIADVRAALKKASIYIFEITSPPDYEFYGWDTFSDDDNTQREKKHISLKENITPNLAAFALRKVVDFSFQSLYLIKPGEDKVFVHIVPILLQVVTQDLKIGNTDNGTSKHKKSSKQALNAYGKSDLIYSLAQLTKRKRSVQQKLLDSFLQKEHGSQFKLLSLLNNTLIFDSDDKETGFYKNLGSRRLSELFHSLTILLISFQTKPDQDKQELFVFTNSFQKVATHFQYGHILAQLSFQQLTQILENYLRLLEYGGLSPNNSSSIPPSPGFVIQMMRRLRKEKVRQSLFQGKNQKDRFGNHNRRAGVLISRAMWSSAKIVEQLEFLDAIGEFPSQNPTNSNQRNTMLKIASSNESDESIWEMAMVRDEGETLCHTLLRCLLKETESSSNIDNTIISDHISTHPTLMHSLSSNHIADILWACVTMEFDGEETILEEFTDILVDQSSILQQRLSNDKKYSRKKLLRYYNTSIGHIARILWAYQRLRWNNKVSTIKFLGAEFQFNINKFLQAHKKEEDDNGNDPESLQIYSSKEETCDPKAILTILRSVVLLCPGPNEITKEVFEAASALLLTETSKSHMERIDMRINPKISSGIKTPSEGSVGPFLSRCNEFEVSNIAWSLVKAHWTNPEVFSKVRDRILEDDILESCSPSSASRFLWSYATLTSLRQKKGNNPVPGVAGSIMAQDIDAGKRSELDLQIFHKVSPILLSTQLTPVDVSSAMWAMGKISYNLDLGIFDHLADLLASEFMLSRATTKHLSQALWACGRMVSWEDPMIQKKNSESSEIEQSFIQVNRQILERPPYWNCAEKFALTLATNVEDMNSKDLAQSIWAIGKLDIRNDKVVDNLVNAVVEKVSVYEYPFNSQETANILWGMSKVGFRSKDEVLTILDYMITPHILKQCSSQEAANVLMALGKMKISEEYAFSSLSNVMMEKLEEATPQGIANALWAHQKMGFQAPQQLFDGWANQKLGLLGLSSVSSTLTPQSKKTS